MDRHTQYIAVGLLFPSYNQNILKTMASLSSRMLVSSETVGKILHSAFISELYGHSFSGLFALFPPITSTTALKKNPYTHLSSQSTREGRPNLHIKGVQAPINPSAAVPASNHSPVGWAAQHSGKHKHHSGLATAAGLLV